VFDLAGILQLSDKAFIVGGQALNLWAERYSDTAELAAYGPYTSKDIDYFGRREAAEKLAAALGGQVLVPHPDDHTPQTAIVKATIGDQEITIDFLWNIKGVDHVSLERQAVEIVLNVRAGDRSGELRVPIMHPLHCMQSRLANVTELHRNTALAKRQLEASPIVLREYLSEVLGSGQHKHVTSVLQALYAYLISDPNGRRAHRIMTNDPAAVLSHFQGDERLDERWRTKSLVSMLQTIADRRTSWRAMKARLKNAIGQN
jgi:hypothetical protein